MSEVRLVIRDSSGPIHGTTHGSVAEAVIAALSAEPETIPELKAATQRFIKPIDGRRQFGLFRAGMNEEPWDAGIVIVDLAARIVAADSSYSAPQPEGEIQYHDGSAATDIALYYRLPDDWLFVYSVDQYKSNRDNCAARRVKGQPLDVRQVLYGLPMIEFIVSECVRGVLDSHQSKNTEPRPAVKAVESMTGSDRPSIEQYEPLNGRVSDPIAEIHARWLMTPREDLRGQSPREVMLAKRNFIDFDLQYRELQWSMLGEGPAPLSRDSFAYRFAGFGTHENVIYYDLMRHLLSDCWRAVQKQVNESDESTRLNRMKETWLNEPQPDFEDRIPIAIIESERRRIPLVISAKSMMIDEDCPLCQMLAEDTSDVFGPGFWHLDGSNMDEGFAFSFNLTREEWDEEERQRLEFDAEFNRKWAKEHSTET